MVRTSPIYLTVAVYPSLVALVLVPFSVAVAKLLIPFEGKLRLARLKICGFGKVGTMSARHLILSYLLTFV